MMRQWIVLVLAMLTTTVAFGNAKWPLPDNVRPQTVAQTWFNNDPKVDFSGKGQIRGATNGIYIGYGNNNKLNGNHTSACDDGQCQVDTSLRLSQKPDFSTPNGATSINLKDRSGSLSGGIYQASGEVLLKSGNTLTVTAPSTLYANKFKLDGGRIDVKSGNPDDLIIVTTGDSELTNGSTVDAHILSEEYLMLKGTTVTGTLITNELKIDEGGLLGGALPSLPDVLTCRVNGNNEDFVVEFDVIGSNDYQEIVFSGGNESDTLWYTQQVQSGSGYVFNEQRLFVGQEYKLRIEVERGQGNSTSRAHYYWVVNGIKELQESKDADLKNGTIKGTGVGLESLDCFEEDVDPPVVEPGLPDICPYFPDHLAGNNYSNGKPVHNNLTISNGTGNPGNQIFMPTTEPVSFNTTSVSGVGGCVYDGVTSSNCKIDANKVLFNGSPLVPDSFVVEGESIHVPDASSRKLVPGSYDTITFGMNGSKLILEQGEYWINEFKIANNDASIDAEGPVVIHYNSFNVAASRVSINSGSGTYQDNLVLIGHGKGSHFWLNGFFERVEIKAHWYVSPLAAAVGFDINAANRFSYTGAIVTPRLFFRGGDTNKINAIAPENCDSPILSDYRVELTPLSDIALTCETIDVQVQVTQKDGTLATNFTGTVTVEQTNGSTQILTPESGVLDQSIVLTSDTVMTKKVTAYITDNRTQTEVEAQYKFVPYRLALSPNPLSVIAGKAEDITVRPLECSDSGRPISSVDFEGVRELTLSKTVYDQPTDPAYSASIELRARDREGDWVSAPDDLVLEFNKVDGEIVAVTQLRYAEAGEVSLALMDQECIEDAEGNLRCKDYSGSQTVLARPWTFAICDAPDAPRLETGSSTSGNGFVAAGESFSTLIKPIAWQGSDGQQDPDQQIETTQALCDSAIVTQNFSAESAPSATISLAAQLASPNGGAPGHFTDTSIAHYSSNIDGGVYQLDDLSWSEVGSLKLYTSATEYLGQKINIGYRHVGRFYPAYFSIDKTKWHVPSNQGEAAYLGQPYEEVEVEVYPYNAKGQKVRNYSLFSPTYQAQLALEGEYEDRILGFDTDDAWKDDGINSAVWQPELNNVIFSRKADGTITTKEDGPFNTNDLLSTETDLNLTLSGLDPVSFASDEVVLEAELAEQPPARYGRMTLLDVGGATTADIRVPLRVEYFDGRRFVTNGEDNATEFDSGLQCILSGVDTTAAFGSAGHQVEKGISQQLFVSRDVSDRERLEQVRLYLRQGDEVGANPNDVECNGHFTQPWLQYNWRNKGDEDPSAMITFGIYRGNDKVIFRGERGLTGR